MMSHEARGNFIIDDPSPIRRESHALDRACLFVLSHDLGKEGFGEASAKDLQQTPTLIF